MKSPFLYALILGACALGGSPRLHAAQQEIHHVYHSDYVVVGMGTAGAGIAKILSDDPHNSVIGLEAGKNQDHDSPIQNSTSAFDLEPSYYARYFYQQEQRPEAFNGRQYHYTTGFLWGGGSSINGEQYVQGTNKNYQRWEDLLGSTWSVGKIRKTFRKLEKYNGSTYNYFARGHHGPVDIRQAPQVPTTMAQKLVNAIASATAFPEILDYNDPLTPLGPFTRWQLYQVPNGNRENSSTAYLEDILTNSDASTRRKNLHILSHATVLKILFNKSKKAIGVLFEKEGKLCKVLAKKKVVLSTGIFSAKLLMLSGIGPKLSLQANGIPVVYNNPNVGRALVNHPIIAAVFTANPLDPGVPADDPNALYVGGAFLPDPTQGSDQSQRGVQLIGMSGEPGTLAVAILLLDPKSRGAVDLQSNDIMKPVLATDAIFTNPADLESIKNVFRIYVTNIAAQVAAIDPTYQLVSPSAGIIADDVLLTNFIKDNVDITHHWMGTCRMAPQQLGGVVDQHGHVYGVKDLVIADTSIAPFPNDGNTSAPSFMIGRRIAHQLLKADK